METRRNFLKKTAAIAGGVGVMGLGGASISGCSSDKDPLFKISLAEWSLNKSIFENRANWDRKNGLNY